MKVEHFLTTLFLKKNSKGKYREVRLRKPNSFAWESGGARRSPIQTFTFCSHCGVPMPSRPNVVTATCINCRKRTRIAAL